MNRREFMRQLKALLFDLPKEEREAALEYYESYFDEAGPENEEQVIKELGSPEKVARMIKADMNDQEFDFTKEKVEDYPAPQRKKIPPILLILVLIILFPVMKGAIGGILGVFFGILFLPFILIAVLGAGTVGIFSIALTFVISGIGMCFSSPAQGILFLGIGFVLIAVGLIFLLLLVLCAGRMLPKMIRWFTDLCHRVLRRFRGKEVL